ncbi:uncharacterized protein LOC117070368 isoform X1 [Trachypithecus francoisi]|uniref:uncharacterized protein LOC117070368 isoform X1 n=1 Tax=Trachypithecus francoisi TaxID=54180 RepID=UPI00141B74F6|nr:uncharacterized protein LOC117070368 isoform X1 [Trachypithecus francoisi]
MGLEAILPGILPLEFHSFVVFTAFRHLEKDVPPGAPTGPLSRTGGSQRRTCGSSWQKAGGRGSSWPAIFEQCWRPYRSKPLCCRGESMSWDSAGPKAATCHSSSAGLHPETRQQLESSWRGSVSRTQLEAEDAQLERVVIDNSRKLPLRAPGYGSMLGCQLGCWLPVRLRYQRLQTLPCLVGGREARPTYLRLCAAFDPPTQSPPSRWSAPWPAWSRRGTKGRDPRDRLSGGGQTRT